MHSVQLKIDDSIFDKVMGMLELLPQDKIKVKDNGFEYPAIDQTEAEKKVDRAIKGIADKKGLSLEDAFIAAVITK